MLELNKIYSGDNLNLLKNIDNNSINLHLTSPPYAGIEKYNKLQNIPPGKYVDWIMPRIKEIGRTMCGNGSFILNINDKIVDGFRSLYVFELIVEIGRQTNLKLFERLIWNKGKFLPNSKRFSDKIEYIFWYVKSNDFHFDINSLRVPYNEKSLKRAKKPIKNRFNRNTNNQDISEYKKWNLDERGALPSTLINIGSESKKVSNKHFAVFPLALPTYFIKGATKENDLVCDIFAGMSSSCIAAAQLKRNFIGIEIDKEYCLQSNIRFNQAFNNNYCYLGSNFI